MSSIKHFTRIQSSREFQNIYNNATKVWHSSIFVLFYKKEEQDRVGFVASKKLGNAVHRNRAKRLLRAHFIENIKILEKGSYILVAKAPIFDNNFQETKSAYIFALKKCFATKQ